MDRRYFLKQSGIGLATFGFMAAALRFLHQFASAAALNGSGYGKKQVLVDHFPAGATVDGVEYACAVWRERILQSSPDDCGHKAGQTDGAIKLDDYVWAAIRR